MSVTFDPDAKVYGFSVKFAGKPPHFTMSVFTSLDGVMAWADPWKERIWEETSDADESRVLISRHVKEGALGY